MSFSSDSILPVRDVSLKSALYNSETERIHVDISGEALEYPQEWLRVYCPCEQCFNPKAQSYQLNYEPIAAATDIKPNTVCIDEKQLRVVYSDGHVIEVSAQWLYNRRFTEGGVKERIDSIYIRKPIAWQENFTPKRASYKDILEMGDMFEYFGDRLCKDGMFIITDVPDKWVEDEYAEKTGQYTIPTHYGQFFDVQNKPTPTNGAYTTGKLELHVDLTHLIATPQIQYLHFMIQSDNGGESIVCDSLKAALLLRERYPDHYKTMTQVPIHNEDIIQCGKADQAVYMANSQPVIILKDGEPAWTNWSFHGRSSFFNGSIDDCERHTAALREYYKLMQECSIVIKNTSGDIMVTDNQRVMHGRLSYQSDQKRKLEGWYSGWDSMLSQLRVQKIKKMNRQ